MPNGLYGSPVGCNQISLNWNESVDTGGSGLAGYKLYRNGGFVAYASAAMALDGGLEPQTTYNYTVAAYDNAGNVSAQSSALPVDTGQCPSAPSAELLGFVPGVGKGKDVAVDAATGRAYVASSEFGLSIVDVADPSSPVALGAVNQPFFGEHVASNGALVAVTAGSMGLRIIDTANPYNPQIVGTLGDTTTSGVAMAGSYAYVLLVIAGNPAHTDLAVVDLSQPWAPAILGQVTVSTSAFNGVAVEGSRAYVAAGSAGLLIVDVSTPSRPWIIGNADTPGSAYDVAVKDGYAYIADGTSVQIVDATQPTAPVIKSSIAVSATAIAAGRAATGAMLLYALGGTQLHIVDASNPSAPALLSSSNRYGAQGVAVAGSLLYLATPETDPALDKGGLYLIDVSNPRSPSVITNVYGGYDNWSVTANGSLAVVTANSLGMRVVDVSNPSLPQTVGAMTGTLLSAAMTGAYACVLEVVPGNPAYTDLVVVNLGNPSQPSVAGRVTIGSSSSGSVKAAGNLAYVAAGSSGFKVMSIANPGQPSIIGSLQTSGAANAVALAGSYAYVGTSTALLAVDVRDPASPRLAGSLSTSATALAAGSGVLYAIGSTQFKVISIADPANPALVSSTYASGAQSLDTNGSLVVLARPATSHFDPTGGLHVYDATNPTQPQYLKQIVVPGTTRSVTATSAMIYAGDSAGVVDVIGAAP